jgi:hypothetical protein
MQNNRSDPSAVPGDLKPTDRTLLKETDLQRCIESLQRIICDLLIENEKLRQHFADFWIHTNDCEEVAETLQRGSACFGNDL